MDGAHCLCDPCGMLSWIHFQAWTLKVGLLNFPQRPGPQLASCLGDWELVTKGVPSSGSSALWIQETILQRDRGIWLLFRTEVGPWS